MVLIFSIENDFSTSLVTKWLNYYKQKFIVINTDDNIYKFIKLNKDSILFQNIHTGLEYNLLDFKSCWWRRTGISLKNFTYTDLNKKLLIENNDVTEFITGSKSIIESEFKDLREYIFDRIYNNCKINIGNPKLFGLNRLVVNDIAKSKGFITPEFEIVSNINQIYTSKVIDNKFVTKAISDGIYNSIGDVRYYTYTESYNKRDFDGEHVDIFPSLITNLINKKIEIRSFYLDGEFFSMAIFSQSDEQTSVDFRKYNSINPNRTEPYKLPKEIESKLKDIFDECNLNTGSADLILDENDNFVFLEINPVGQYSMTSDPCNYNLDKIIAKYLIHGRICKE